MKPILAMVKLIVCIEIILQLDVSKFFNTLDVAVSKDTGW